MCLFWGNEGNRQRLPWFLINWGFEHGSYYWGMYKSQCDFGSRLLFLALLSWHMFVLVH